MIEPATRVIPAGGFDPAIFDHMPDAICLVDDLGRVRHANAAFARLVRRPVVEIIGRTHLELFHCLGGEAEACPVGGPETSRLRKSSLVQFQGRWYQVLSNPLFDGAGHPSGAVHVFSDVSELKHAEEALLRANRVLRVLNLSNESLVKSVGETALLKEVCGIIVETGGFQSAWIGLMENGNGSFNEVARAGVDDRSLESLVACPGEPGAAESLAARTVRSGRPAILRSLPPETAEGSGDPAEGQRSPAVSIAVPLITNGLTLGVMAVRAVQADAFAEREVQMLTELAADLAYGVAAIRISRKHEEAVRDLQASEIKYATLVEKGNDGIVVVQNEKVVFVNSRMADLVGRPVSELVGTSLSDHIVPGHIDLVRERYRARLAGDNPPASYEVDIMTASGERLPVELSASGLAYQGRPATLSFVRDIRERRLAERKIRENEERFRTTLERMLEGCQIIGTDWRYLFLNEAACRHGRRSLPELLGHTVMEAYPGIEKTVLFERMRESMENRVPATLENEFTYPDGVKAWFEVRIRPVPEGIFMLTLDISERKAAEVEVTLSSRFLEIANQCADTASLLSRFVGEIQDLTGCQAVAVRLLDDDGNIPYKAYAGFSREFFETESPLSIKSDACMCINVVKGTTDAVLPFYTPFGSFYMNGTTRFLATVSEEAKGKTRNVCNASGYESVALIPFRLGGRNLGLIHLADRRENMVPLMTVELLEKIGSALAVGMLRTQAEESLRRNEEKYRSLFESTHEAVALFEVVRDDAGRPSDFAVLDINPAYESLRGVKKADRVGKRISESPPPMVDPEVLRKVAVGREPLSYETQKPSLGKSFRVSVFPVGEARVAAILSDITARDQAREQIRKLTEAVEQSPTIVVITDVMGKIEYVNPKFSEITGYSEAEIVGSDATRLGNPPPDDLRGMWQTLESGRPWQGEFINHRKSGEAYWERASIAPVRDGSGTITHYIKVAEDVTEPKKRDEALAESERRLREANRLLRAVQDETIGAIATMAELRDPYTSGHQRRVARLSCAIAKELGWSEDRIEGLGTAGLLHDIGKIQVPSDILTKPGRLSAVEFELIKSHAHAGYQILKAIPFPWPVADAVAQHHERMDGSGYPGGLSGEQILMEARIIAVADVIEAMASHRPYRAALGIEAALEEVSKYSGRCFDSAAVQACLAVFSRGFELDESPA